MSHEQTQLGIIAGGGLLPALIADELAEKGITPVIVALDGIADGKYNHPVEVISVGLIGKIIAFFKDADCHDIVIIGKFIRPSLNELEVDSETEKLLDQAWGQADDAALKKIAALFAEHGLNIADSHTLLSNHFANKGVMVGQDPDAADELSIARGVSILQSLGAHDVGQGLVIQENYVLAVEAAEGTNAMIDRASTLANPSMRPPILVKMLKSGQDRNLDMPVVGLETIERAYQAGIKTIALEAEEVLIADKQKTFEMAQRCGMTLKGVGR